MTKGSRFMRGEHNIPDYKGRILVTANDKWVDGLDHLSDLNSRHTSISIR